MNLSNIKPNYFKTFLANYLVGYKNILEQKNPKQKLKELEVAVEFCIQKFKTENDLIITHQGRVVNGVSFNLNQFGQVDIGLM